LLTPYRTPTSMDEEIIPLAGEFEKLFRVSPLSVKS
jgi:hypothetical protein